VVATVPVGNFPLGVAVTADGKYAYVANAGQSWAPSTAGRLQPCGEDNVREPLLSHAVVCRGALRPLIVRIGIGANGASNYWEPRTCQCVASASVNSNAALSDIRTTIGPIDVRVDICKDLGILEISGTSPASIPSISRMTGVANTARLRGWGGSFISRKSYSPFISQKSYTAVGFAIRPSLLFLKSYRGCASQNVRVVTDPRQTARGG